MRFQTNTKPLATALALGIINSNVSNFQKTSHVVQVSADANELKINIEASRICTELRLKGNGEGDPASIFVDSLLFKQLVSTFDSATVTLEISTTGLIIYSGKHKFTLPKMIDSDFDLKQPARPADLTDGIDINKADWKFIKEHQMFALSMSFVHPVFTRVWVGQNGDVLVGDFDSSLFTYSTKSKLGATCLLQESIINLFESLPEGAKLYRFDSDYLIHISNDSFDYLTQLTPEYEDRDDIGSYRSDIFLPMLQPAETYASVNVAAVTRLLNQALLLSSTSEDTIKWVMKDGVLKLHDKSVDGAIPVEMQGVSDTYEVEFKLDTLKKVIANYPDEVVNISPMLQGDVVAGVLVWNAELTTALGGVE